MGKEEMVRLANWMDQVVTNASDDKLIDRVAAEVAEMCKGFPAPGIPV
jgi:glycine hydroxymethyltransferase